MRTARSARLERQAAFACVTVGIAVSVALAPKDSWLLSNAAFYWGSQLAVLALLLPIRPRPAVVAGVALALAMYLAAFGAWVFTRARPESMAWLGYAFSLPGAAIAGVGVAVWFRSRVALGPLAIGCIAASAVLVGVGINQAIVCSTVIYCGGK
jgi:hypothetical protein